jgi:hypothetical protein
LQTSHLRSRSYFLRASLSASATRNTPKPNIKCYSRSCLKSVTFGWFIFRQLLQAYVGKKQAPRILVIAGFAAIAALVGVMGMLYVSGAQNSAFKQSWDAIAFETVDLTRAYQAEEGKWNAGQYDNETMIGIIDDYMPRYQSLVDRAEALDTPEKYVQARDLLVKAIQTEKDSNEHFKTYLLTGDEEEREKRDDLFSLSLKYSAEADAAIAAAG